MKSDSKDQTTFLPKYMRIKQEIAREIRSGRLPPGSRVSSESEIMQEYGVGRMTANRALRLLAEDGLVVRIQGHGTFVDERPTPSIKAIEWVFCGKRIGVYGEFMAGIESRARELGFTLVLSGSDWDPKRALKHAENADPKKVSGVIYRPVESYDRYELNQDVVRKFWERSIPVVCIDNRVGLGEEESYVASDNFAKARELTFELLHAGYSRVGFVAGPDCSAVRERVAGYREALEESGVAFDPDLLYRLDVRRPKGKEVDLAVDSALQELAVNGRIDAVFCICDFTALAVISMCRRKYPDLAEKLAIVGYDDLDFAHDLELTTVRQPLRDEGRVAMDCLNRLIEGEKGPFQIVLPGKLVRRKLAGHMSATVAEPVADIA